MNRGDNKNFFTDLSELKFWMQRFKIMNGRLLKDFFR